MIYNVVVIYFQKLISSRTPPVLIKYENFNSINHPDVVRFIHNEVKLKSWSEEVAAQLFICISSAYVVNELIKAVIKQNTLFAKGRIEFFATIPAYLYCVSN